MSTYVVEIEFEDSESNTRTKILGPFRSRDSATLTADNLGRASGLTQNPDIPGLWIGFGSYEDDNGWHIGTSVTISVRAVKRPLVRPLKSQIKGHLRGES